MSTWGTFETVLLICFIGGVLTYDIPDVLTTERRIQIFGTNTSTNLPTISVVQIELINRDAIKPFRKRPPKVLQYRATINDEVITLSLRHNRDFIAPGCLVHNYAQNGTKTLAPCLNRTRHCYYTGRSMNHTDSWVAASVCGGLRGAIVYGNTSLIVSPLEETFKDIDYPGSTHVVKHVVYKYQGDKQKCSTNSPVGHVLYPPPKSRRRREATRRYLELSVVIDPTMVFFHGSDLDQYTATALNIASRLYANQKTGQDIVLVISSIHKMESYEDLDIEQTKDALSLLNGFCSWKARQNDKSLQTDAAIYLTKVDIAYKGVQGTTGLALPNGTCDAKRNCALIEDTGPMMGYTIAHEIGHLLSLQHDGPGGDTACGSSIMNVQGTSGSAASTWSTCSKRALEHFLSSNDSECLLNKPLGYDDHYGREHEIPLPGVLYTADDQCKYVAGPTASLCPYEAFANQLQTEKYDVKNACEQIFCRDHDHAMCNLFSFPLLDGTDINNTRTWCIEGEPVAMTDADKAPPINGGWSEWSGEWSTCSRTCGGGVKIQKRKCNNPKPQFNGMACTGSEVKAVMCNFEKCMKTFKETQCSELDSRAFPEYVHQNFTFVPYMESTGDMSCKLQCVGHSPVMNDLFLNNTKRNYADGTDCRVLDNTVPFTRCIDGKCREFGCDGHLGSGLLFDECGRCNGTGADCKTMKGTYNRNGTVNVSETVLVLPKGSADITINQTNGYCFLNILIGGEPVLNSSGYATSGVFMSHGIRIIYIKYPEHIRITEPLPVEVQIQVYRKYDYKLYENVTPNIDYQYNEIISSHPSPYSWSVVTTQCSKTCDSGLSVRNVTCWGLTGPVEDHFCEIYKKPNETPQPCNTHPCPPRWDTTEWSRCSVSCGNGTRNRSVECIQEKDNQPNVILDTQCSNSSRPAETEDCNMRKCPSVWKPGNWGPCSKTCGDGSMTRDVHCYDYKNTSVRVPADECDVDSKPNTLEQCHLEPCRLDIVGANCTDLEKNCAAYGSDICVGEYQQWAEANCMKFCRICDACEDNPLCSNYIKNNNDAFCNSVPAWTKVYCRPSCGHCSTCKDSFADCHLYDRKYCKDLKFVGYMKTHCEHFCGYC